MKEKGITRGYRGLQLLTGGNNRLEEITRG